jgi:probable rRNA maturation factor
VGPEEKAVMPLKITIDIRDEKWKALLSPYRKTVQQACEAGFRIQDSGFRKISGGEVSVVLANDAFVRKLNHAFRGKDKPTNVLSFPSSPPESCILNPESYLGDIILARQTILREAKAQKKTPRDHAVHLIVHGMLHLQGYDHERHADAENMEALEVKILKKLGIGNPYL